VCNSCGWYLPAPELRGAAAEASPERVRRKGGGRRPLVATDPSLLPDLKALVEPTTRGDPMAPLFVDDEELAQPDGRPS
jgi:hypothetical protein